MFRSPRPHTSFSSWLALPLALGFVLACSGEQTPAGGAGTGGDATGGSGAAGGATPTGGAGNAPATGGVSGANTGGVSGANTGGSSASAGDAGSGATGGASTGGSGGGGASTGGASTGGASTGGTAGGGGDAGAPGGAGNAGASGSGGQPSGALTITPANGLWTGVRYYTAGVPSNRTSGPAQGPSQTYRIHNGGTQAAAVSVSVSGARSALFEITAPTSFPLNVAAGADADVTLRLVTATTALGTAPAQDSGATVLEASLDVTAGTARASAPLYALVLTYVELEPTFGQILDAFPEYTSNLPNAIRNDANPNPPTLPGVEAGTDEVRAPVFRRANASLPVTMRALGRFSPPGLMPFGWYPPGDATTRTTVGTLAQATDQHTNNKSRMLLPPLASGTTSFEPPATFGLFMQPAGVGLLTTEDAEGFDGAHRVKVWTLRNAAGTVLPNQFLLGGEEAANGDYQDYVFVVTNVEPVP